MSRKLGPQIFLGFAFHIRQGKKRIRPATGTNAAGDCPSQTRVTVFGDIVARGTWCLGGSAKSRFFVRFSSCMLTRAHFDLLLDIFTGGWHEKFWKMSGAIFVNIALLHIYTASPEMFRKMSRLRRRFCLLSLPVKHHNVEIRVLCVGARKSAAGLLAPLVTEDSSSWVRVSVYLEVAVRCCRMNSVDQTPPWGNSAKDKNLNNV